MAPYVWAMRRILGKVRPDLLLTYNWGSIDALLGAWSARFRPIVHHECGFGLRRGYRAQAGARARSAASVTSDVFGCGDFADSSRYLS